MRPETTRFVLLDHSIVLRASLAMCSVLEAESDGVEWRRIVAAVVVEVVEDVDGDEDVVGVEESQEKYSCYRWTSIDIRFQHHHHHHHHHRLQYSVSVYLPKKGIRSTIRKTRQVKSSHILYYPDRVR